MLIHEMSDRIALKMAWLLCPSLSFSRPLEEDLIPPADLVDKLHVHTVYLWYVLQECNYKTTAIRAVVGITCTNSFVIEEDLLYNTELSLI